MEKFIEKSSKNFESALKSFELLSDTLNAALIQSNFGKLLRLRATMVRACAEQSDGKTLEFTPQEKLFYTQVSILGVCLTKRVTPGILYFLYILFVYILFYFYCTLYFCILCYIFWMKSVFVTGRFLCMEVIVR